MNDEIRHSEADQAEVVTGDLERAKKEASNGVIQAERVQQLILNVLDGRPFKLRTSTVLDLNRCAIAGLDSFAGNFRPGGVKINKSKHQPPEGHLVPELVEELCDYVNDNWTERSSIHLASMVMWRMNWIHPFTDGNGRTSRAVSYLVLCANSEVLLRGAETIPEQIVVDRLPYYTALEAADLRYEADTNLNENTVEQMEDLMRAMLARQLRGAFDTANSSGT
ncbi:MAG: Fic family protein [Sulfitobacter sp.]